MTDTAKGSRTHPTFTPVQPGTNAGTRGPMPAPPAVIPLGENAGTRGPMPDVPAVIPPKTGHGTNG
jgi:hypothetical protein